MGDAHGPVIALPTHNDKCFLLGLLCNLGFESYYYVTVHYITTNNLPCRRTVLSLRKLLVMARMLLFRLHN